MEKDKATRVLLVDDDQRLTDLLSDYLDGEGFTVEVARDGATGLSRAQSGDFGLVVLDVMLPQIGGFEVLRGLRASGGSASRTPVLMLSARGEEIDRVVGLELGADDYLAKPFSSRELVARLRAMGRRAAWEELPGARRDGPITCGDLQLLASAREVKRDGVRLDLTGAEFDLLRLLVENVGQIVTRETISQVALGRQLLPFDRSIDVHISNLRRKLGAAPSGSERIKAVRGIGYLLAAPAGD